MSVFGTNTGAPIVIKSDKAIITLDDKTLLATGVNISYQRPVGIVPVLNEKRVISVGEGQGTINIETLLIAEGQYDVTASSFLSGDGCNAKDLTIKFQDSNCDSKTKPVTCHGCVGNAVSIGMQAGRGFVVTGVGITFTAMDV